MTVLSLLLICNGSTARGGDGNDSVDLSFSAGVVKTIVEADGTLTGVDTVRIDLGQVLLQHH